MRSRHELARSLAFLALGTLVLAGCGSKSPLRRPNVDAAPPIPEEDAGVDAGPPPPDFCVELPFQLPPRAVPLSFESRIVDADVFFLVDVTGSMGDEINQIRNQIRTEITPGIAAAIPSARFSVGHFADFPLPLEGYGGSDDEVFRLLQRSTTDLSAVQRAVSLLDLQEGADGPESMVEALYQTATGEGIGDFVPPARCPVGTMGYPCFDPEGARIIVVFTDAPSHNGPGDTNPYRVGTVDPAPHDYQQTVSALRSLGAKVLGIYSGGTGDEGESHLIALARDTGAIRPDGTPLVFQIGRDGEDLAQRVVEAVRTLVEEVLIDVDVVIEDLPDDDFDALEFVDSVVAVSAAPPDGAVIDDDKFHDVRPGTRVDFSILLHNSRIPQTNVPQDFLMRIVLRGDGVTRLRENIVRVVIPSRSGEGCDDL